MVTLELLMPKAQDAKTLEIIDIEKLNIVTSSHGQYINSSEQSKHLNPTRCMCTHRNSQRSQIFSCICGRRMILRRHTY